MSEKIISHPDKGAWILDLLFDISYIIIDLKRVVLLAWRCKSQKKKKSRAKPLPLQKQKPASPVFLFLNRFSFPSKSR